MIKVGSFGVDSGQFMIIDPCYVWDDDFNMDGKPTGKPYDAACRLTLDKGYGELEGGFVAGTLYGDGEYDVYAEVSDNGRIVRLTIEFGDTDMLDLNNWLDEDEDED